MQWYRRKKKNSPGPRHGMEAEETHEQSNPLSIIPVFQFSLLHAEKQKNYEASVHRLHSKNTNMSNDYFSENLGYKPWAYTTS